MYLCQDFTFFINKGNIFSCFGPTPSICVSCYSSFIIYLSIISVTCCLLLWQCLSNVFLYMFSVYVFDSFGYHPGGPNIQANNQNSDPLIDQNTWMLIQLWGELNQSMRYSSKINVIHLLFDQHNLFHFSVYPPLWFSSSKDLMKPYWNFFWSTFLIYNVLPNKILHWYLLFTHIYF